MERVLNARRISTSVLVKIGILSAISFVLMLFDFPIPFFPPFLKIDASDVPAVIGALAMGPMVGTFIVLIKVLLNLVLTGTDTVFIGEISNFLVGAAYVIPLGIVYSFKKNIKSYILGAMAGTVSMVVFAAMLNYFALIPIYATLFGGLDKIIALSSAVNAQISDLLTLILLAVVPFNLIKGVVISILGYLMYKVLTPILQK